MPCQVPLSEAAPLLDRLSSAAETREFTIGTVESLTGGLIASHLASEKESSSWYRGGIVAYHRSTKHDLLRVPEGPVVSETAARTMTESSRELLEATISCGVTGVGGPDRQDGMPVGTVYLAIATGPDCAVQHFLFEGSAEEVLQQTVVAALSALAEAAESLPLRSATE